MTTQALLWSVSAGSAATAVLAAVQEVRRRRRADLDRVGWVPWDLIQVLGALAAVLAAALALRA
jgi:hypothetical protein